MSNEITQQQVPPGFTLRYFFEQKEKEAIREIAWSPDGQMLAFADTNNIIRICYAQNGDGIWQSSKLSSKVSSMAWSPDGKTLAVGCGDTTIRLFDIKNGDFCSSILKEHSDEVWNLAYSPNGEFLASNSRDRTTRLWNTNTWQLHKTLEEDNTLGVFPSSLAWFPDGRKLLSGNYGGVYFWDPQTGESVGKLEGDLGCIKCMLFSPQSDRLAIASGTIVQIWDFKTGQPITLESHVSFITCVSFSCDGRLLVSQDQDGEIRIWRCDLWEKVAFFSLKTGFGTNSIAFHSNSPLLATVDRYGLGMSVWNLDIGFLLNASEGFESVRYRNAKVVLVGDTGVGKSGLGSVLAGEEFKPTISTHGRHVWSMEVTHHDSKDGLKETRETLLWDLAGQVEFRLIHQLSLDETTIALVLFDGSSPTDPFKGVTFWNKALRQAAGSDRLVKYLVAARTDVSTLNVTDERMNEFASRLGFQGAFRTSALTGEGVDELRQQISMAIDWETLPLTVSERLFKRMKDFIINQKKNDRILKTFDSLKQQFKIIYPEASFNDDSFRIAIQRVEAHDLIKTLSFGDYILLQPELIDNYASAMARAARKQPDGLGFLEEQLAREGQFNFDSLERIPENEEQIVLQSVVELFITKELAILDEGKLVFPSQFNRELPEYPDVEGSTVSYQFEGALLNAYATLVVRLYHSEGFPLHSLWKNAAIFLPYGLKGDNNRCGFLLEEIDEGTGRVTVFFGVDVSDATKILFLKYVHEHLRRKALDGGVQRERLYRCPSCLKDVKDRTAVKFRLERGISTIPCLYCSEEIDLQDLIEETFGKNDEFQAQVRQLDETINENLDNASKDTILKGEVMTIVGQAGQIFRPIPNDDWGIDGEIEFKNNKSEASGQRIYVQLKSGNSYLNKNKNGDVTFYIEKERHIEYWLSQPCDVYLIVRDGDEKIYWMNVTEYLKKRGNSKRRTIVFNREEFTVKAIRELKRSKLPQGAKLLKPDHKKSEKGADKLAKQPESDNKLPVQLQLPLFAENNNPKEGGN